MLKSDYEIRYLSRKAGRTSEGIPKFFWDPEEGKIDRRALDDIDYLIHLAGAGIADKPWTRKRKETILRSRVDSTTLLKKELQQMQKKPKLFIGASAIGYYGGNRPGESLTEDSHAGDDFLAEVTKKWENAGDMKEIGIPTSHIRIGVVLSRDGGALPKIMAPIKLGLGAALGSGKQVVSWVHIQDLIRLFLFLLKNQKSGVFNGVAPEPVTNKELTRTIAEKLGKPLFLPNVPTWALKLVMGEMAVVVTGSAKVSAEKTIQAGFEFNFKQIDPALDQLLEEK